MPSIQISSKELLSWRRSLLLKGGRAVDLDWLLDLGAGLSWSALQMLYIDESKSIDLDMSLDELTSLWEKHRMEHIPLQYLLRRCPWRDFELEVGPGVLIPRQESELLIDLAISKCEQKQNGVWADLGTGSGAIAVGLSRSFLHWEGHAVDCCNEALSIARRNLDKLSFTSNYQLHLGSWWEPLTPWWGKLNLVLANPPYIPISDIDNLSPEVRNNEPHLALCGGSDGLSSCRKIISGSLKALAPKGWLIIEHHYDQSDLVLKMMEQVGLSDLSVEKDLQGIKRFALARNNLEKIC